MYRRTFTALLGALLCLAAFAGAASASTLTRSGGTLTWTAANGINNDLTLDQPSAAAQTVEVDTTDDPVTGPLPANCNDTTNPDQEVIECDDVTTVVANSGDGDDEIFAVGLDTIALTADGGTDDDTVFGGNGNDTIAGGAGNDSLTGDGIPNPGPGPQPGPGGNDTVDGGPGFDGVAGGKGNDTVTGGDGGDFASGGPGNDTVSGGAGSDGFVAGGPGTDTVSGDAGDDVVAGDCGGGCGGGIALGAEGNDTVNGGTGQDLVIGDAGTDTVDGGPGTDTAGYVDTAQNGDPRPITVTLDGVANDGAAGENDVLAGIEDVFIQSQSPTPGGANITGDAGTNQLTGDFGNDTINGGAGNDFLTGNAGDDTLNANDGYADRVSCGDGTDTANIDNFDQLVSDDCETVNVTQFATLASEDKPPTVAWTSPASAAKLSTTTANTLAVTATDDKGISKVVFLDDEKVVCEDTTAPYTCDYKPTGDDVGRNTLLAIAIDTSQQTASAVRSVQVPRFAPRKLTSKTTPKADTSDPRTFVTTGRLTRPTGVTPGQGCRGKVAVTFKAGKNTISTRRVNLKKNCTYRSKVTFEIPSRLAGKLQVVVRFAGNAVLTAKSAKRGSVTT